MYGFVAIVSLFKSIVTCKRHRGDWFVEIDTHGAVFFSFL